MHGEVLCKLQIILQKHRLIDILLRKFRGPWVGAGSEIRSLCWKSHVLGGCCKRGDGTWGVCILDVRLWNRTMAGRRTVASFWNYHRVYVPCIWGGASPKHRLTCLIPVTLLLQVLEKLQGHLELLEQEFLDNKEKHLTLKQVHRHESPAVGDFDPERSGLNCVRWRGQRRPPSGGILMWLAQPLV